MLDRQPAARMLVCRNDLGWDEKAARHYFIKLLRDTEKQGKIPVLSHERLLGNPHSGHYDMEAIARRPGWLFPTARIIIVIREQYDLIASIYKQYIRIGGTRNLTDYTSYFWDTRMPRFDLQSYCYDRVIELYYNIFGIQNVHIALFEDLHVSQQTFLEPISKFIGINVPVNISLDKVNPSIMDNLIDIKRLQNIFLRPHVSFREPGLLSDKNISVSAGLFVAILKLTEFAVGRKSSIRDSIKRLHGGYYRNSNACLEKLINRKLFRYGYEL